MDLAPSSHADTFARDHLPPFDQWPTLEFTTDALRYPDRLNAATEIIDVPTEAFGAHRPALRTPAGEVWTYGDLQRRANQVAQLLVEDLGLATGNRVLLRSPNNPWAVACWLGVLKAGGIVVTTMAALRGRELAPIVDKAKPRFALVDHRHVTDVLEVRARYAGDLTVLTFGSGDDTDLVGRCAAKSGQFTNVETSADDVALFCPTSGSTGVPKLTTHFHRDLLSIDNTFGRAALALEPDDVVSCTAPIAFTFGLGMLVVFPLRAGACALLSEAASPVELAGLVAGHGVTVLATAPTAYKQIIRNDRLDELRGLRTAVSAGEHIARDLWEQVHEAIGLKIIDGIGATEMLHIFISAAGNDIRPGATGRPLPGYRATVLGPDDREVPPGVDGRLAVIGPIGCRYLDDDRQSAYVVNGWNVTGDVFARDEDGYFHYRARTDSMIVSSGYNIGGPEVEAALDSHPDVAETAVVPRPDAERGSVVCAFVVLRDGVAGDDAKRTELQTYVKQRLAPYKYPRDVRFCDALPRNANGKLQHFVLRRIVADEQDAAPARTQ